MRIHKFETTEAFIAIDLEGAEASSGPARWAKKILQGGAKDLARSQTYTYAALGMGAAALRRASAPPEDRAAAVEAFLTEAEPLVADGTYLPDAARASGSTSSPHSTPLTRDTARLGDFADHCDGLSAVVAAHHAVGLDAKTIAIEGFETSARGSPTG